MMTGGPPILGNLHIFKAADPVSFDEKTSLALRNATDQVPTLPESRPHLTQLRWRWDEIETGSFLLDIQSYSI